MNRRGFTLIELLIVVAIIAILAAIAVPNFLEAQTRSKVSRVMSDMRSLATGIEAYTVDYTKIPPDPYDWGTWMNTPGQMNGPYGWDLALGVLTTPVAYITSVPTDPFIRLEQSKINGTHIWYLTKSGYWTSRHEGMAGSHFIGSLNNYVWCMDSPGPDRWWEFDRAPGGYLSAQSPFPYNGDVCYYDSTNGTNSQGDIYYYGSGAGINPPPQPKYP
jgi:prepilin-type N-terminal cleavage/methylation domain-containing protein